MKTKRLMSLAFAMGILHVVQAQVSIESNFPFSTSPPDYVGWNGSTTIPLEVRHNGNQPIEWYTDSLRRMLLMETDSYDVGGSTSQDKDGFLLLCPDVDQFYSNGAPGPYTTLHLAAADDNAQEAGYRPNMGNGITMTGNDDQMYVGQLFNGLDYTDAAIVWSDNPGEWLADRLTFNFTSNYTAGTGMNSMNGLQTMLIQPDGSGQEAFVGLGDFDAASEVPVERLDVLDGRVRIRQLPTELEMDTSQQYVVVNGDGVLGWRNIPTGTGGADCDWAQDASHNLYTAIAPVNPGSCPDLDNRVAIGNYPSLTAAKLHVEQRPRVGLNETAIKAVALVSGDFVGSQGVAVDASTSPAVGEASATIHYGLKANALNADKENYGVYASASNNGGHTTSQWNVGVYGHGAGDTASYGVYGHASGSGTNYGLHGWAQGSSTNNNFGVYGKVTGGGSGTNYAGYFSGNFHVAGLASCTYNVWSSDASIKTDVEEVTNAMDVIAQLRPSTYRFLVEEHVAAGLPSGLQRGLIAQDLAEVLPDLVHDIHVAAVLDSSGLELHPGEVIKGVNYIGLIPMLIAGIQEQQATISAQTERLDQLESLLLDCCNRSNPDGDQLLEQEQGLLNGRSNERSMQVVPNPFQTETTIHYNLDRGGRVQLMANSADGKQLRVLNDATSEAGVYQFNWNTADLAAGIYYVTLLLDGEPITKRAVKIER